MPIIGTAGHVDHGKSTLVEALTGRDPDRWAEEKARGLTIDLGFAWTRLGDQLDVGFVDVPGHERFIKNMLAGVGALDVALFVVAADAGWMPQSEEHLAILDLLEVRHGVIAVTRIDLVDEDLAELAVLDVDDRITGTGLADWPIVPVSVVTGEGLDALRDALATALAAAGPPVDTGRPRLWIDRSFVISGAGIVVTGTLTGGSLHRDAAVTVWPGDRRLRIRGLQSHEHELTEAAPGTRTAVNLAGVDATGVTRGNLLTLPDAHAPTSRVLVDLRLVRAADAPITSRGAFHLHAGTGAWPVEARVVEGHEIDDTGAALLTLSDGLPFEIGDRVILREVGRRAVVAGGRVLDPSPRGRLADVQRSLPSLREIVDAPPDRRAAALLDLRGTESIDVLAAHTGGGAAPAGIRSAGTLVSAGSATNLLERAEAFVRSFQASSPLRPGMPKPELASSLDVEPALLEALIESQTLLVDSGGAIRTSDFVGGWGSEQEAEWMRIQQTLRGDGLAVRRASQLAVDRETFHALLRDERLVRIADDLVYLPEQIDAILDGLTDLHDGFTIAEFRDALALSRRHAVPLLEWLDARGWTSRRGDVRTVRRRREPGSSDAPTP
jgi:selenocysteine-specific elongation factor